MSEISNPGNSHSLRNAKPAPDRERLVHALYDAVLDNALWPEIISELLMQMNADQVQQASNINSSWLMSEMTEHFDRALRLSECIVELKEKNTTLTGILDALPMSIAAYRKDGSVIHANAEACRQALDRPDAINIKLPGPPDKTLMIPLNSLLECDVTQMPSSVRVWRNSAWREIRLISADQIENLDLPFDAALIAIGIPVKTGKLFSHLQQTYYLTDIETCLLTALSKRHVLREAAASCALDYGLAETLCSRICTKVGVDDINAFLQSLDKKPLALLKSQAPLSKTQYQMRQSVLLPDGHNFEYFSIGPEDGKVVVHLDGMIGVSLDILGSPERYLSTLEQLNLRIIVPCRAGTYRSDFKSYPGYSKQAIDIICLLDSLGIERFTLLSQTLGTGAALSIASLVPESVDQVLLCAANYPDFEPDDWRSMDMFYIITSVIGKRAPWLLRSILPFLIRSIMQDPSSFIERSINRSACAADIAVLQSPNLHWRAQNTLAERSANGFTGIIQEYYLSVHGWDFDFASITCPVHLLHGALDNTNAPQGSKLLSSRLPNAQLSLYSDFGQYLLMTEWPWILEMCAGATPINLPRQTDTVVPVEMLSSSNPASPITTQH